MSPTSSRPRRLLGALLLTAAVLVGLAVTAAEPASAAPAGAVRAAKYLVYEQAPVYDRYAFRSPSGNIRCSIAQYEDTAPWGCYVVHRTWKDPKLPDVYGTSCAEYGTSRLKGAVFTQYRGSGFFVTCRNGGDTVNERSRVLPIGSRITAHRVTCASTRVSGREAMTCTGPKGAKLVVTRSTVAISQPKG